jgi:Holliday junction DNA helicase RuvA
VPCQKRHVAAIARKGGQTIFYYINGVVSVLEPGLAVLDCGGVGYALNVTANTLSRLKTGEKARLYTYSVIREDCFDLYGFATQAEKRSFELLLGVSGVGPRAAQSILSSITPENLAMAVVSGNEKALTAAPGIGKKLAQRVILELKDKLARETDGYSFESAGPASSNVRSDKLSDAAAALPGLGYANREITIALRAVDTENLSLEEIVRQSLKQMLM